MPKITIDGKCDYYMYSASYPTLEARCGEPAKMYDEEEGAQYCYKHAPAWGYALEIPLPVVFPTEKFKRSLENRRADLELYEATKKWFIKE